MRPLLYTLMVLAWLGPATVLVLFYRPQFKPDRAAYIQCATIHPERYCRLTHLDPDHGRP